MHLTLKQTRALDLLEDHTNGVSEILFGGGAGGGKSQVGAYWLGKSALKYPGTRWLMARKDIITLKETTLVSFFDVMKRQGATGLYQYSENRNEIRFKNGSIILLKELKYKPSDEQYDSLGSLEITGGFIDEIPQITQKAWQVAKSRIRYKLDDFGLSPKLLGSCNPSKAWVYAYFYKAQKEGKLEPHKAFIQSLLTDNPHISKHYLENLRTMDQASRERLMLGNWEYDDDPTALMGYDAICDLFRNQHVPTGLGYITADIARMGDDKTVIRVWSGWRNVHTLRLAKKDTREVAAEILKLAIKYQVPMSRVVVDEDGVGGGVRDQLPGAKGFLNGSSAVKVAGEKENYENLKTQCGYRLAKRVNEGSIWVVNATVEEQEQLTEEMEQVKRRDADKDGPLRLQPKQVMAQALGRSPDWWDALMMREYFELVGNYQGLL
ncbi:hypothetical protein DNI29_04400 [Hymenobacter sediminis]|uniref:phage terminase large subunit n=1 Tax=Hymenobacter sediminis TaxID=2218621 RepID=UPI000DA68910|nr:phage terminase large subunit [Hymenobacter sediminis]RPD50044.1 hypothetical protein DNI29_04400 [Hymenobacter sediminis]